MTIFTAAILAAGDFFGIAEAGWDVSVMLAVQGLFFLCISLFVRNQLSSRDACHSESNHLKKT